MSTSAQRMNDLVSVTDTAVLTMSSREIADLVEKRHDNVKRTIETLEKRGVISVPQIEEYLDSLGRPAKEYKIGKRDSFVIVAQLSPEFTARLVDRWQELESNLGPKIPQTLPEALRLAADLADNLEKTKKELEVAAPKASALDRIASKTEGAVCLRIAAKLLQMPEKKFIQFAHEKGFIFRNHYSRVWQGYGDKAKKGLVELKITEITRDDGSVKNVEQVLITRAGIAKLAELLEAETCGQ